MHRKLADLIRQWLYQEKNIRRIVPILGEVILSSDRIYSTGSKRSFTRSATQIPHKWIQDIYFNNAKSDTIERYAMGIPFMIC